LRSENGIRIGKKNLGKIKKNPTFHGSKNSGKAVCTFWNYKGAKYPSLGQDAPSTNKMGYRDILGRIDRAIQVDHGPVANKTQLFLTKYTIFMNEFPLIV